MVVDTDVVSYLFKRDSRAETHRVHLTSSLLLVSFMTVAELDRWTLERDWGEAPFSSLFATEAQARESSGNAL